jgi:chaperonin GroEL (HSP60 family)
MSFFNKKQIKIKRATENIIPPLDALKMFGDVFTDASNMMKCTIGPAGGNTLVTEPYASTPIFPTKDGFRVMNNHLYDDIPYEATFRMVRDLSSAVNQEVGDGTTSVVIIAAAIYRRMAAYLEKHKEITPFGVKNIFNEILERVSALIQKNYVATFNSLPHELKVKIYEKIATIAANNDSHIGKTVAEAYAKSGSDYTYIDIQESLSNEDIMDVNLGFEITTGYIDRHMVTNADGITAEYTNPFYLIVDGPLISEDLPSLIKWVEWSLDINTPLVIIAAEYHKEIFDFLVRCRTSGISIETGEGIVQVRAPILAVMLNTNSQFGMSRLHDLECALGAKALTTNNGKLMEPPQTIDDFRLLVGRSDSVISKPHYIRIRGGGGSRIERDARIAEIEREIASCQDSAQHGIAEAGHLETLKRRAGMLQGEMHCIRVGGDSYKEKKNRALIYEDAIMAVKNAIKHGIVLAGNMSIYGAIKINFSHLKYDIADKFSSNTYNIMIAATQRKLEKVIGDILTIIAEESLAAFKAVLDNASDNKFLKRSILKRMKHSQCAYNILSNKYECFRTRELSMIYETYKNTTPNAIEYISENFVPNLISPGNMDIEILRSTFSILGLFLTSNQLVTVILGKDRSNKI